MKEGDEMSIQTGWETLQSGRSGGRLGGVRRLGATAQAKSFFSSCGVEDKELSPSSSDTNSLALQCFICCLSYTNREQTPLIL